MTSATNPSQADPKIKAGRLFSKFRSNIQGTTAIEFAMVGLPFLMLLFGTMIIGLFFFTTFAFENAVERAGRVIRTGQAAISNMSEAQFKTLVCDRAPQFIDCDNKVKVFVQSFADNAANFTPMNCVDASGTGLSTGSSFDIGGPNSIVLATVCYQWELSAAVPIVDLGNMGSTGYRLIQATTTFRNEVYE